MRTPSLRPFVTLALILAVCIPSAIALAAADEPAQPPQIIAVKFHAAWCGSCKVIEPHFKDLHDKFDGQPVLFLDFDLTNRSTTTRAGYLASAMKLDKVFNKHAPSTGFVLLIDARTGEVLDRLTKKHDFKAMSSRVRRALARADTSAGQDDGGCN